MFINHIRSRFPFASNVEYGPCIMDRTLPYLSETKGKYIDCGYRYPHIHLLERQLVRCQATFSEMR